ncbi:MAG TPA: serine hydrolase domain-containing protein [Thermoanaerobaculia bacterium]|jgi:CubicO group peptidase (beta-lactamase class C family)|nr:serine hydrolase domain-containing protein [Thermoanaerobaculia bacterium]
MGRASLVVLFLGLCSCTTASPPPAERGIVRLDGTTIDPDALTERIEELTRAARVQGLTVTVFNDARTVYSRAFGFADLPAGRPLRTDTELYGASLSKAVFAVLAMKLVEQGIIDLDTPLQDYLDEPLWKNRSTSERAWHEDLGDLRDEPRTRRITTRMSLSHTTGFPNWRWFEPDHKLRIHFEPGQRFSYSGEGMTFLQIVLEKLTGKPLEQLMQEQIFGPYGMRTSSYTWQARFEKDYALGHRADGTVYEKDKDNAARAPSTLETTTEDYARFIEAVLRGEGLRQASWDEIFRPQVRIRSKAQYGPGAAEETGANDGIEISYGLGWGLYRTPHAWGAFKDGHGDGFQHYSIVYPTKRMGVLVMSNSDNAESIFGHLLAAAAADTSIPLEWFGYIPYDRKPSTAPGNLLRRP